MTVEYGFFDKQPDGTTDAEYREDQASVVFGAALADGLWPLDDANGAATVAGDASGVYIAAGTVGFAQGFYFKVTADELVPVDAADASARIDRIVARLDRSANTFLPVPVKGTPGSVTPPALVRDDNTYDLRMWLVTRATNGALTLTEDRDWGAIPIFATTSDNQPPSSAGYAFEWQTDANKFIRRDGSGSRLTLLEDSGDLTLTSANTNNWQVRDPGCHGRRLNREVHVELNLERVDTTLQSPSAPNGSNLTRLPTNLRPHRAHYFAVTLTAGRHGRLDVQTDGYIVLRHISEDVTPGRYLRADISYLVG